MRAASWVTRSPIVLILMMIDFISVSASPRPEVISTADAEADLRQYMDDALEGFKSELFRAGLQNRHKRSRRDVMYTEFNQSKASAFEVQVESITPYQSIPTMRSVELQPFQADETNYLAVVNYQNISGSYAATSEIYRLNRTNWMFGPLQQFRASGAIDFEFADFGFEKFAIFVEHYGTNQLGQLSRDRWFQVNQLLATDSLRAPFYFRTRVRSQGGTSVKTFESMMRQYFVTANSFADGDDGYHVKSTLHARTRLGFELVQTFDTKGARDVEVMMINNEWFIVFANHRDNAGETDIYSSIYKERSSADRAANPSGGMFALYQQVLTHGARDVQFFTYDGQHYLAFANEYTIISADGSSNTIKDYEIDSVIYWWTGKIFIEWQKIPTHGAVRISHMSMNQTGEPILIVSNSKSHATIYTFDPLRAMFKPTNKQGLLPFPNRTDIIPDVRSVIPFRLPNDYPEADTYFFAVANYNDTARFGYNVFKVKFSKEPTESLAKTVPEIITEVLDKTTQRLQEVASSIESIHNQTRNIMTKDGNETFTGRIAFETLIVRDKVTTGNFIYTNSVDINPIADAERKATQLRQQLSEQEQVLRALIKDLDEFVKLSEDANVTGRKTFSRLSVSGDVNVQQQVLGIVNDVNLIDVDRRVWKSETNQLLTGTYTFASPIHVNGSLTVAGTVNGVKIDQNIMRLSSAQVLNGSKTFIDDVTILSNVSMERFLLNGYDIAEDLLRKSGNQTVSGRKSFQTVNFNSRLTVDGLVDGVNLTSFDLTKLTTNTEQVLGHDFVFEKGFAADDDLKVGGLVDGVNLTVLRDDIWLNNTETYISGKKTFSSINVLGSASVESALNGESPDRFATLSTNQVFTGNLTFTENVVILENLTTTSVIDGLDLSTEAVTTNTRQEINGRKSFSNVLINAGIQVNGTINGVDLAQWQSQAVLKGFAQPIAGNKSFASGVNIEERFIVNTLDGINMHTLKDGLISLTSDGVNMGGLDFDTVVVDDDVHVKGTINGYMIPDDFVLLDKPQNISGRKTFSGNVDVAQNLSIASNATLNGLSLASFAADVVKIDENNDIAGMTSFTEDVTFLGNISVAGKVDGLDFPTDFVTIHTDQNMTTTELVFANDAVFTEDISAHIVHVGSTVNGIDISLMESEAVYKDRNQSLSGSKVFSGNVDCLRSMHVGRFVTGVNVSELHDNTFRISQPQTIIAEITLSGGAFFEEAFQSPGRLQGVDLAELYRDWLSGDRSRPSELGDAVFDSDLTVTGNVTGGALVNGINLTAFIKSAVKADMTTVILDGAKLTNQTTVQTLNTVGFFDGVDTANIMHTKGDQDFVGHYSFDDVESTTLSVDEFVTVHGITLSDLAESVLKVNESLVMTGSSTFRNITVYGDIVLGGTVNGIDISEFDAAAVHLTGNETITGSKSFRAALTAFERASFLDRVNDVNLTLLLTDSLAKSGDQQVCQRKTFTSLAGLKVLESSTVTSLNVSSHVNGIDFDQLMDDVVRLSKHQDVRGSYQFDKVIVGESVTVSGTVNGLALPDDVLLTFGDQKVNGSKSFVNMTMLNNLQVLGQIDGIDIGSLNAARVTLNTAQHVTGQLTFQDQTTVNSSVAFAEGATLNDIDLSAELISTSSNAYIPGQPTFNNVAIAGDLTVEGTVNDVDVGGMATSAIKITSVNMQQLVGVTTFMQDLEIVGDILLRGTANNIYLEKLANYSSKAGALIDNMLNRYQQQADEMWPQCNALVQAAVTGITIVGVEKRSVLNLASQDLGLIDTAMVADYVFVSIGRKDGADCGDAYILRCSSAMSCTLHQTISTRAAKLEFFLLGNLSAVYVPHWSLNSSVIDNCKATPEIYVLSGSGYYELYSPTSPNQLEQNAPSRRRRRSVSEAASKGKGLKLGVPFAMYVSTSSSGMSANTSMNAISADDFSTAKSFKVEGKSVLARSKKESNSDVVELYAANVTSPGNAKIQQRIVAKNIQSVEVSALLNSTVLSIAEAADGGQRGGPQKGNIKMYVLSETTGKFEFLQNLPNVDATAMSVDTISSKSVLSFSSPSTGIGFCEWRGDSGFDDCKNVPVTDVAQMDTVVTQDGAFMVALSDNRVTVYQTKVEGNSEKYVEN